MRRLLCHDNLVSCSFLAHTLRLAALFTMKASILVSMCWTECCCNLLTFIAHTRCFNYFGIGFSSASPWCNYGHREGSIYLPGNYLMWWVGLANHLMRAEEGIVKISHYFFSHPKWEFSEIGMFACSTCAMLTCWWPLNSLIHHDRWVLIFHFMKFPKTSVEWDHFPGQGE